MFLKNKYILSMAFHINIPNFRFLRENTNIRIYGNIYFYLLKTGIVYEK